MRAEACTIRCRSFTVATGVPGGARVERVLLPWRASKTDPDLCFCRAPISRYGAITCSPGTFTCRPIPARRQAVVGGFDFDATVQMHHALACCPRSDGRLSRAVQRRCANWNGRSGSVPLCGCSPASSRTIGCVDIFRSGGRGSSGPCRNRPGPLLPAR